MGDGESATPGFGEPRNPTRRAGNHTNGVTVADLIAKVSRDRPDGAISEPRQRRARSGPAHRDPDTDVFPAPRSAEDIPDLGRLLASDRSQRTALPRRDRRTAMWAGRAAAALIAASALVLTGAAWQWQAAKNRSLNQVSALDLDSRDILDPNAQFGDENFLIVGVDSRIGENIDIGAGSTDEVDGARSDTIMLVNIPANRERVVAVSFPRDLAITPMKCKAWDPKTGEYEPVWDEVTQSYGPEEWYTETKLNSAYAYGGPRCLVRAIQKLSGLSVNRFMAVDFAGFSKMVDAMGGVEVCSTTPLQDYELGTVLPTAGWQRVDGHTALNYVRARSVTSEINGDYGRIKRQQMFLSSLMRSLISKEVFFSLSKLNNVVNLFIDDSYVDNIDTRDLVTLGQSIQGVAAGRITFLTVPTGVTDENGDEPPRTDDMRALFDAIINDDPLPGEVDGPESSGDEAAAPETTELVNIVATDPEDVTVQVSNSTAEDGQATAAASKLQQYGFTVTTPDDYPKWMSETTVLFSPGNEQAAATVASAFANPAIKRVSGMSDTVQVVLGSDFSSVRAPSPDGSSVRIKVLPGTDAGPELPEDLTVTNAADTSCD